MVLIHKLLKKHSLQSLSSRLLVVAISCVFLASKVRYMPFSLKTAAQAYFAMLLKEQNSASFFGGASTTSTTTHNALASGGSFANVNGGAMSGAAALRAPVLTPSSFTQERENYYKELIEAEEQLVLEAIAFDFECIEHLPYSTIRTFCEKYANFASREQLHFIATSFCNDSFKLPLCLYYHPKIIAAACIQSAMVFRMQNGCN